MNSSILADTLLRSVAMAVAQNKVGANKPLSEVAAMNGMQLAELEGMFQNPTFVRYVDDFIVDMNKNGLSIQAKARVLVEDLLPTMYHLARDIDQPAAARIKTFDSLVDLSGAKPKNDLTVSAGAGFQVNIVFPEQTQQNQEKVIDHDLQENAPFNLNFDKDTQDQEDLIQDQEEQVTLLDAVMDAFDVGYEEYEDE